MGGEVKGWTVSSPWPDLAVGRFAGPPASVL